MIETLESLSIIDAKYVDGYVLSLTFSNGETRLCDFEPLAGKGVCLKLKSLDYFKNFTLDPFTVDWNNEIGFAPEYLYNISKPIIPHLVEEDASSYNLNQDFKTSETEHIVSSKEMLRIIEKGDRQIISGDFTITSVSDLWK